MRDVTVPWVRPDQLGDYRLNRLGDGGQGVVYGVPRPPARLPGTHLAFKEYKTPIDADVLHDMCCFPGVLGEGDRAFLEPRLTWPVAMVYTGRPPTAPPPSANPDTTVVGFLMPRIPGDFELDSPALGRIKPQALEYLLNGDDYMTLIGLHVDDLQRLRLLIDLARTLDRLHRLEVAVGDLSPKNVLFTQAEQGRCLLIDCDSMRYRGRDVLTQVETTGWEVPEKDKGTVASDSFKYGLLALRLFNRSQDSTDPGPLREVSPELADLALRSQRREPHRRPRLADWLDELGRAEERLMARRGKADAGPDIVTFSEADVSPATGSSVGGWVVAILLFLLVMAALNYGVASKFMSSIDSGGSPSPVSSGSPYGGPAADSGPDLGAGSTEEPASTLAEAPGATVNYSLASDEPDAEEVAALFADFFGAINTRDYDRALSYYDPATTAVDLNSTASREEWKRGMATTQDSGIVLRDLDTSGGYTFATLHFRSRQSPGYGPPGRPNDTCTHWTVTYQLTRTNGYRILEAPRDGVFHAPC